MIIMWKTSFFSFSIGRAKKCVVMSETRGSKARCKTRERVKEVQDEINSNVETHAIFCCCCCDHKRVQKVCFKNVLVRVCREEIFIVILPLVVFPNLKGLYASAYVSIETFFF